MGMIWRRRVSRMEESAYMVNIYVCSSIEKQSDKKPLASTPLLSK